LYFSPIHKSIGEALRHTSLSIIRSDEKNGGMTKQTWIRIQIDNK